ncbi:MAG: methyltransferase domain-containing protein [Planctomycetes bacterium]|nr:methyltransferase domain-containing protein [Planctomycetota bacterium]
MDDDGTSAYAWPAGDRLVRELGVVVRCAGASVCDLGCGRGALGLAALSAGARSVAFADLNASALALARQQVTERGYAARATFHHHRWGSAIPGTPYEIILGGDILYRPECFADLMTTIRASLAANGCCVLSDPRTRLEEDLPLLAAGRGLSWNRTRRGDLTVITLTATVSGDPSQSVLP